MLYTLKRSSRFLQDPAQIWQQFCKGHQDACNDPQGVFKDSQRFNRIVQIIFPRSLLNPLQILENLE